MDASIKRLQKELEIVKKETISGLTVCPIGENLQEWSGTIIGPTDTPFEGGKFQLKITFPKEYPFIPPKVLFITPIFHPNIDSSGKICVNILKDNWTPSLTIQKVLLCIMSLLAAPNPDDPLVPHIALCYKSDQDKYNKIAREWVNKYAK